MNQNELKKSLSRLALGDVKFFESTGSTNDEALAWAANDAPDMSLVIADEQTAGRGRLGRKWITPKGTALAFSIILNPTAEEKPHLTRLVGLAALAVASTLQKHGLSPQIKWPNDILILGRKAGGILTESVWTGEDVDCVVIGIGLNVSKGSIPPAEMLQSPATSLEDELGHAPNRVEVLNDILTALIELRPRLGMDEFISQWESQLAWRGETVRVDSEKSPTLTGQVIGLESDGSLRLRNEHGEFVTVRSGDVHLRPLA